MKHIIDLSKMSIKEFDNLYKIACDIMDNEEAYAEKLKGKILASLFFEPSTRTNLSFTTAMYKLGGQVIGFSDSNSSSTSKGESLKDTVKTISQYADIIVIRNPYEGSAYAGSLYSEVPVINAGDGGHLHPTQTLTDLITIKKYRGSLENMTVGICGDLKNGRTVHSLIKSLAKYKNVDFVLISPNELRLPNYIINFMNENNISYQIKTALEDEIQNLDILYMTRVQRERFDNLEEYMRLKDVYILDAKKLEKAKENLMILHPLPRVDEISNEVDFDSRAYYFKQAKCGIYGRMALILSCVLEKKEIEEIFSIDKNMLVQDKICKNKKCITQTEEYLPIFNQNICAYCDKEF